MTRPLLLTLLVASLTLPLAALPDPPHDRGRREWKEDRKEDRKEARREWKEERRERKEDRREDRREDRHDWRDQDRREHDYWRGWQGREYHPHRYFEGGHDRGRRPIAPPWMNGYWRRGEGRRYVALVPGDPSRMYVFLDGRWVLRHITDSRARIDLEGAFRLPVAPPPIAPPHIGLDLHVVLFN